MRLNRRSFFAALAALPIVGRFVPTPPRVLRFGVITMTDRALPEIEIGAWECARYYATTPADY